MKFFLLVGWFMIAKPLMAAPPQVEIKPTIDWNKIVPILSRLEKRHVVRILLKHPVTLASQAVVVIGGSHRSTKGILGIGKEQAVEDMRNLAGLFQFRLAPMPPIDEVEDQYIIGHGHDEWTGELRDERIQEMAKAVKNRYGRLSPIVQAITTAFRPAGTMGNQPEDEPFKTLVVPAYEERPDRPFSRMGIFRTTAEEALFNSRLFPNACGFLLASEFGVPDIQEDLAAWLMDKAYASKLVQGIIWIADKKAAARNAKMADMIKDVFQWQHDGVRVPALLITVASTGVKHRLFADGLARALLQSEAFTEFSTQQAALLIERK
jgi:hypothetical protein